MKYTILGFSQPEAINRGLDIKDLTLLRWLVDFYGTGKMELHIFEAKQYFWVHYQTVLRELPILGINSKDVLARRLKEIASKGVLEQRLFEGAGNKTYFRFQEDALYSLLSDAGGQGVLFDRIGGGSDSKVGRVPTQKSEGFRLKSRTHIDSSTIDSSTSDIKTSGRAAVVKNLPYPEPTKEQNKTINTLARKLRGRFNVFQFMQRVSNKIGYPPPPDVMIQACEDYLENSQEIKDSWGWFTNMVRLKSGKFFAELNIAENERYKKEPVSQAIKNLTSGIGNG